MTMTTHGPRAVGGEACTAVGAAAAPGSGSRPGQPRETLSDAGLLAESCSPEAGNWPGTPVFWHLGHLLLSTLACNLVTALDNLILLSSLLESSTALNLFPPPLA